MIFSKFLFLQVFFLKAFPTKILYAFLVSLIQASYTAHCNFFDFISVAVLGDLYK
jgi:hypothetical protein